MPDALLIKKLATLLHEICRNNQIRVITYLEVEVDESHLNTQTLLAHLKGEIPTLINSDTKIKVNKGEREVTVIKTVEGIHDDEL